MHASIAAVASSRANRITHELRIHSRKRQKRKLLLRNVSARPRLGKSEQEFFFPNNGEPIPENPRPARRAFQLVSVSAFSFSYASMSTQEERVRKTIDALLMRCGWVVQSYKRIDPSAGRGLAVRDVRIVEGRCDYLLLVDRNPVGFVKARKKADLKLSAAAKRSGRQTEKPPDYVALLFPSGSRNSLSTTRPPAQRSTSATNAKRARARDSSSPSTAPRPSRNGSKNRPLANNNAIANGEEAIAFGLKTAKADGRPVPPSKGRLVLA